MVTETIFAGRNNTFSLQLVRGEEPINLLSITGYELVLSDELKFNDQTETLFTEKDEGIVEISIGHLLDAEDIGVYKAYLITFDSVNTDGVRWPTFTLKVQ